MLSSNNQAPQSITIQLRQIVVQKSETSSVVATVRKEYQVGLILWFAIVKVMYNRENDCLMIGSVTSEMGINKRYQQIDETLEFHHKLLYYIYFSNKKGTTINEIKAHTNAIN